MSERPSEIPVVCDVERVNDFCRKWRVTELAVFGSTVRGEASTNSDVDLLVSFEEDAPWSLWDWQGMRDELEEIFGRKVDLVEKDALRNPYRKQAILAEHRVIYAA